MLESFQNSVKTLEKKMRDIKRWKFQASRNNDPMQNRKQCYNCGSTDHFRRDCKAPQKGQGHQRRQGDRRGAHNTKPKDKQGSGEQGHVKLIHEPGIFVKALVNGVRANLLIDTGATVSLISRVMFDNDIQHSNPVVSEAKGDILSANKTPMKVKGKTKVDINMGDMEWRQEVIISDINVDGILGIDFLKSRDCVINLGTGKILISGEEYQIHVEGLTSCYRITVAETVSLPPRSEMIISGTLCKPEDGCLPVKAGIVEPSDKFRNSDFGMVARALVRSSENIPLRLMNPSSDTNVLHSGTEVGKYTPVAEIHTLQADQHSGNDKSGDVNNAIPEHVKDLFERCTSDLSSSDKKED